MYVKVYKNNIITYKLKIALLSNFSYSVIKCIHHIEISIPLSNLNL